MAKALTAVAVAKARAGAKRREIPDGGCRGLHLVIQSSGHKSWALRYRSRGRTVKFTLGPVLVGAGAESDNAPQLDTPLSLAAARELATKALRNWHGGRSDYVSVLTGTKALISISEHARSHVPSDDDLKAIVLAAERDELFGSYVLFTLLTATRRGESAGLRRRELSPDGRSWLIPAARYKSKRDTVVPLSVAAQKILAAMPVRPGGDYVFSADGASELGNWDARKARFDAACGVRGWVIHDLRRAARTLLSRAGVSSDIAERCLGHAMIGVRETYDRHQYEPEKRHAFEALARMVEEIVRPPAATVV